MRLDADRLHVDPKKLRDYLLAPEHPEGGSKARFFLGLGFTRNRPWELGAEIRALASSNEATAVGGPHGTKYVVDGELRSARVRTVWIVDPPGSWVRFVTAYPLPRNP